jgi:hypothetical protein
MVIGCYYLTLMITKKGYSIQKWFANETEALCAFYQKKLTLHSPVLVRYAMNNFKIQIEEEKFTFIDTLTDLDLNKREIFVFQRFEVGDSLEKYYLLTNIGIVIARHVNESMYEMTDLFLETTPGRLIFSLNFKYALQQSLC